MNLMWTRTVLITIIINFCSPALFAQTNFGKAQKHFIRALKYYQQNQAQRAILEMKEALAHDRQMTVAYAELGKWYYELRRHEEAMMTYKAAASFVKDGSNLFAMATCKTALAKYDFNEALNIISSRATHSREWQQLKQTALFQQKNYNPGTPISIKILSDRVNTAHGESFATISADQQTLLYTSSIKGLNDALFISRWDSCTNDWFSGKPIDYPINTPLQNTAATISADAHYLFFTRCDNKSVSGWGDGGCDLVMAYRSDSIWSVPQSFGGTINSTGYEGMPCLSPDNKALYFSSDRPGGFGGKDLWVAFFKQGKWQKPINLGSHINTDADETAPFIAADNTTLFYASTGWPGLGGSDIFRARKLNDTTFQHRENVGYPYNSSANEISFSSSADGRQAWISSDRDSTINDYNLYHAQLSERYQPDAVTYVSGFTYDSINKERLNLANIELINKRSGKIEMQFQTNRGDGSFLISVPMYDTYIIRSTKRGYDDRMDSLLLTEKHFGEPLNMPLGLMPENFVTPVYNLLAFRINYNKNSVALDEEMKNKLLELQTTFLQKQGVSLSINSFTDNSGTPMMNEQISTQRAQLVKDFLIANGWSSDLITATGWGEAEPIVDNNNETNRKINRRVEVVIMTNEEVFADEQPVLFE